MDGVPRRRRTTALAPRWQRAVLHLTARDHDCGAREHRAGFPGRHTAGRVQHGHGGYRHPHRTHELGYCSGRETVPDYQRQIAGNIFSERDSELAPGRAELSSASAALSGCSPEGYYTKLICEDLPVALNLRIKVPHKDIAPVPHIPLISLALVLPLLTRQARQIPVIRHS
jgi:hypothetical protein